MRSRAAAAVLAVVIALVLAGDVVALVVHDDDPDGGRDRHEEEAPEEAVDALEAALPELIAFVETTRGLRFRERPDVELLSDREFNTRLLEEDSADAGDIAAEEEAYLGFLRALGLIEGEVNLDEVAEEQVEYIVGFYDTDATALFVRGTDIDPYVRSVLIHELTHALDDQHFGLDREELVDDDGAAFAALVEGSALIVESRWYDTLSPEDQAFIDEAEGFADVEPAPEDEAESDIFTQLLSFPYAVGPPFVEAVIRDGSQARLDGAFRTPPTSSEQVLHPERFLRGERLRAVADPTPDGPEVERGSLGELGLILVLDGPVERNTALRAANGWGGDRYVTWTDGARTCLRWNLVMDSSRDTTEVVSALRAWAAGSPGATVRGTSPVVVTSCG